MAIAYCYRSGEILIGDHLPYGSLELGRGRGRKFRQIVEVLARHASDGKTLLVPGIPEADSDAHALQAAEAFIEQLQKRLASRRARKGRFL